MLKSITIENLKGFGEKTTIPLAPITVLYGENSAGKSSILQALAIVKAVAEKGKDGRLDLLFPKEDEIDTGNVGSFRETITDSDLKRTMLIRVEYDRQPSGAARESEEGSVPCVFEVSFKAGGKRIGCLESISLQQRDETWHMAAPAEEMYKFFSKEATRIREGAKLGIDVLCLPTLRDHPKMSEAVEIVREAQMEPLEGGVRGIPPIIQNTTEFEAERDRILKTGEAYITELQEIADFYGKEFDFATFIDRMQKSRDGWVIEFDRDTTSRASLECRDFAVAACQLSVAERDYRGPTLCRVSDEEWCLPFESITDSVQQGFLAMWSSLSFLQGMRAKPQRSGDVPDITPQGVGPDGALMSACLYHRGDVRKSVNEWLHKWGQYTLQPGENTLMVTDHRMTSRPQVTIADVGFGLSQVLPILTQAFMKNQQTIAVQQPEEHIHPRLQAEFGSFVADNVRMMANQFIIETHSETLMLRLQKLIRKGELKIDDIRVLYVSRTDKGSQVQELRLNETGEFIDEWPGGFFEESFKEMFGE